MNRLISALLLAGVAISAPALAQDQQQDREHSRGNQGQAQPPQREGRGGQQQARPQAQAPAAAAPQANRGPDNRGAENRGADNRGGDNRGPGVQPQPQQQQQRPQDANRGQFSNDRSPGFNGAPQRNDRNAFDNRGGFDNRGNPGAPPTFRNGPDNRAPSAFNNRNGAPGSWTRNWRNDSRYNWQSYRQQNRALFRMPRYIAPRGYSYRRYQPGWRIEPFFFDQRYWIQDPWTYRLPPADYPYEWVRYFDDVLLIDVRTGTVVDSIPDFFYY